MNAKQRETYNQLQEEKRKNIDLDSRFKEAQMMNRIKDIEQTQLIADLRHRLSGYDIKVIIMILCPSLLTVSLVSA